MTFGVSGHPNICGTKGRKIKHNGMKIQLTSFWHSFRPKVDCGGSEAEALVGWVEAAAWLAVGTAETLPPSDAGWSSPRLKESKAELEAASAPPPPVSTGEGGKA